jgi:hypothetical protein
VLAEVARLQAHVAATTGLAPRPLAGPMPFAHGIATIEEHDERGVAADPHELAARRAIATALHDVVLLLEPFAADSGLPNHLLGTRAGDALWPRPHSRLFDFDATRRGAEDIDALAAQARAALAPVRPGRIVLGHGDWRAEHLRFDAGRVVLAYDWQSLCRCEEAALVGFSAHAFCADWSRDDPRQAPTLDEARAFVADYERARRAPFDPRGTAALRRCVRVLRGLHRAVWARGRLRRPRRARNLSSPARRARERALGPLAPRRGMIASRSRSGAALLTSN